MIEKFPQLGSEQLKKELIEITPEERNWLLEIQKKDKRSKIEEELFVILNYEEKLKSNNNDFCRSISRSLDVLPSISPEIFVRFYKKCLENDDFNVRSSAAKSLGALAPINPELFVKFFKKGLKDQKWHVRSATAQSFDVLAKTIDFSEVKILTNILKKHQVTHSELLFSYACFKSRLKNKGDLEKWSKRHYLEAFGGWGFPQGKVNGFRIEIEK